LVSGRNIRLVYLFGVAGVLVVLLVLPWVKILGQPTPCGTWPQDMPDHPVLARQFGTVALCMGCLLIGSMASYAGRKSRLKSLLAGGTRDLRRARVLVQIGLALMLLFSTGALLFESWAVWNNDWAVTHYVRCGNDVSPYWAAAGACALCLLLGSWLWHAAPMGPDT
jgi:hypothetical protein